MTNHYVKYEDFVINTFQDNQRKPCGLPTDRPTYRRTDRQTDRQTDISKTIYPLFFEGGHNNKVVVGYSACSSDQIHQHTQCLNYKLVVGYWACSSDQIHQHTQYLNYKLVGGYSAFNSGQWHQHTLYLNYKLVVGYSAWQTSNIYVIFTSSVGLVVKILNFLLDLKVKLTAIRTLYFSRIGTTVIKWPFL
jgi:hypothetical protein